MVLRQLGPLSENPTPLLMTDLPSPSLRPGEARIRVIACGVCHTELDEIESRLVPSQLPIVLGHQAVGVVDEMAGDLGKGPLDLHVGQRVGVAWIASSCGQCEFCRSDRENLCSSFRATGRDVDGGYAEFLKIPAAYAHPLPEAIGDLQAAPLLCAGAIGYRSLRLAMILDGQPIGLMGFGASAHLVIQMIHYRFPNSPVFVFSRGEPEREFARSLGAAWTGGIDDTPPDQIQAAIDTTPAWHPAMRALAHLKPGGRLVINAIRKETADQDVLARLDYASQLWMEKEIKSVANVTRADVRDFLELAARAGIMPEVETFGLGQANEALVALRNGNSRGAKVLQVAGGLN